VGLVVSAGEDVDPVEVVARLRHVLSSYKVPRQILVFQNDLPRLHNGKVDKLMVTRLLTAEAAEG
jgi:non-ribosomal peptide synthetase component E (peptide arylation enzyme)